MMKLERKLVQPHSIFPNADSEAAELHLKLVQPSSQKSPYLRLGSKISPLKWYLRW